MVDAVANEVADNKVSPLNCLRWRDFPDLLQHCASECIFWWVCIGVFCFIGVKIPAPPNKAHLAATALLRDYKWSGTVWISPWLQPELLKLLFSYLLSLCLISRADLHLNKINETSELSPPPTLGIASKLGNDIIYPLTFESGEMKPHHFHLTWLLCAHSQISYCPAGRVGTIKVEERRCCVLLGFAGGKHHGDIIPMFQTRLNFWVM